MTDLQLMYLNARAKGMRHRAALDHVSRETGIDPGSVGRALGRAKRTDERDARQAKREATA